MPLKKSPGGSIFSHYYKNGELYGAHFGSFFDDEAGLIHLIQAETDFFLDQHGQLPYWVDLYESRLTEAVLREFLQAMDRLAGCITRLAIVGCSSRDRRRLEKMAREKGLQFSMPVRYFSESEAAKEYLAETGYDPEFGARPLKRAIQRELQDPLALRVLAGDFHEGETIHVERVQNGLTFTAVEPVVAEPAE